MKKAYILITTILLSFTVSSQIDTLQSIQKVNNVYGGLSGLPLDAGDKFGRNVEVIGDVNLDGIDDIAVSAHEDDDGATNRGAIYILMLNEDGTVKDQQKISETQGNGPSFSTGHINFGTGIAALGDLNGDGKIDIAVGGGGCDDDGISAYKGAVYVLFLDTNGVVLEYQKISNNQGGGPGSLDSQDGFGANVSNIGDLNGDGLPEIAIHSLYDDDGGTNVGATYIGFLDYNGTLKDIQKISASSGGFGGSLTSGDGFGCTDAIGDLDNDGVIDIAIGAPKDDDGGSNRGAVWICFMTDSGYVKSEQKISDTAGAFYGVLDNSDRFGLGLCRIGDLNNDSINDLAVTAVGDDDGGEQRGAVWFLMLDNDGTVKSYDKINTTDTLLQDTVIGGDDFACSVSFFGDRNNDGRIDLLVGARKASDTTGAQTGEIYVIHFNADTTYPTKQYHQTEQFISLLKKHSAASSPLDAELEATDYYGRSIASIGDLNGDGINDMVVGAHLDDDGYTDRGAVYIHFLNANGTTKDYQKISSTEGNFNGTLDNADRFGVSACTLGDLDGDSITDIAVGAFWDDDGVTNAGAVWILFMTDSGYVKTEQKISATDGNFNGTLGNSDWFGYGLTCPGDIDGDGIQDLITSSRRDDDGYTDAGAVWVLFMTDSGYVKSEQKISATEGNFNETLGYSDEFGFSVAAIGDLDGNGVKDIAVGSRLDDDADTDAGAVYILFLNDTGAVDSSKKITTGMSGFTNQIYQQDQFGGGLCSGYDLNLDGINDLIVGAYGVDDSGIGRGTVWILFMNSDGTVNSQRIVGPVSNDMLGVVDDNDRFGTSISVIDYNLHNGEAKLAIGAIFDDDGASDAGTVYLLDLDLSLLIDYTNYIFVNTNSFSDNYSYELTIEDSSYSYTTGGIEAILINDTSNTDTALIAVEATSSYGTLQLLFDIDGVQISNVRIITDSLGGGDTLSLDSSLYQISDNGQMLTLYQSDTSEVSADSLLYGFELQSGLGFSPDGDGDYEELVITGLDNIYYFNLTITDLEETTVFYTEDKTDFWNGKYMGTGSLMAEGTYKYTLNVNGETIKGQILLDY